MKPVQATLSGNPSGESPIPGAGFDPVAVGGLARARDFDVGTAVFGRAMTARELRQALGLVR